MERPRSAGVDPDNEGRAVRRYQIRLPIAVQVGRGDRLGVSGEVVVARRPESPVACAEVDGEAVGRLEAVQDREIRLPVGVYVRDRDVVRSVRRAVLGGVVASGLEG